MDQARRDLRLQVFQLVVDGLPRHGDLVGIGLAARAHRGHLLEDDLRHDLDTAGEGQLLGIAQHGVVLEDAIQRRRIEDPLQRALDHHTDRALFDKRGKSLTG